MIITSPLAKILQKDIDTDIIIPADFLKTTSKEGLKEGCFHILRDRGDFPDNFEEANILLVGENFGCGSSREHAVWALKQNDIQAIISEKFADIFKGNAEKNNLLLIELSPEEMRALETEEELVIDVAEQRVKAGGQAISFEIDPFVKRKILEGMEDIDYMNSFHDEIRAFEADRKKVIPVIGA